MRTMKNLALATMAASALALAGCGGGGGSASAPKAMALMVSFDVPEAFQPAMGTYEIAAGGSAVVNGVQFNCGGPGACTVVVDANGGVSYLGGDVTAEPSPSLAAYNESQSNLANTQAALNTANQNLTDKQAELDTANQNLTDKQAELDTANQNLTDKQAELDTANQNLTDKQTELGTAQQRVNDLVASGEATQEELDAANQDLMDKQAELETANQDLMDKQAALDTANQDLMDKQAALDTANQDLMDKQAALDTALGEVTRLTGDLDAANAVNDLFAAAQTSRAGADAAVMDAGDAVAAAIKSAGMLDVASVKGDSTMAAANAQAVLDAEADAEQAVMDAEAVQADAEGALAAAMALDDSPTRTGLVAALEAAVAHAKEQVAAAEAKRDNNPMTDDATPMATPAVDSLAEAVAAVTGGKDADPQGTPQSIGDDVAMDVAMALLPKEDDEAKPDGTAMSVMHYATASDLSAANPPDEDKRTAHYGDSTGMTWAMIVGEANVMMMRLGANNAEVPVASIAGMEAATSIVNFKDTMLPDATGAAGSYMGIPGMVYCLGDDCEVSDGDLVGSWYFSPNMPTELYIENADGTAYEQDTAFSEWGHWLTVDQDGVTIHTYATTGVNMANLNIGVATGCDPECSASYSGSAAGMSVHKTFDDNAKQLTIDSGAFTADVSLTARFGSAPMLQGTISNFQGGAHVDSGWSVTLEDTAIDSKSAITGGVAKGSGQAADWAAQGYGPAQTPKEGTNPAVNHRPTGFFGSFNAHFTDGHAAGAFVAD